MFGTPADRQLAAVCRKSWGVIDGNPSSAFWHLTTADWKIHARQLELRNTFARLSGEDQRIPVFAHY